MRFIVASLCNIALAASLLSSHSAFACGDYRRAAGVNDLVRESVSGDAEKARAAIAALREAGPTGLAAVCDEHDRLLANNADPADIARIRSAIDAVAKQRDAHASRLYWHTDFEQARALAASTSKPILSLRLLGNLNEDRSCANSRFFRSVLYANREVADYLRDHFVLHWESLRPVPQLTIDFGDGRRIERTITGNSIHYVLDHEGRIIDALPGLYAPAAFVRHLTSAETILQQTRTMSDKAAAAELLRTWHAAAVVRIDNELQADLQRIAMSGAPQPNMIPPANSPAAKAGEAHPLAAPAAAAIAPAKMRAEVKAVEAAIDAHGAVANAAAVRGEAMWQSIAALPAHVVALDENSIALIESKLPADIAQAAQDKSPSKRVVETPVMRVLREFRTSLAIDTVRNEYDLHRTIHAWLATPHSRSDSPFDLNTFNERVYAELFLTPLDDPWMGLAPRDAYTALDDGGLVLTP